MDFGIVYTETYPKFCFELICVCLWIRGPYRFFSCLILFGWFSQHLQRRRPRWQSKKKMWLLSPLMRKN